METAIYVLTEKETPIYIGKTKNTRIRKSQHKRKYPNAILEIIDLVPGSEWKFWEMHYVSLFKSWGFELKNKTGGGNGSHTYSLESRRKMSESHKGRMPWNNKTRGLMGDPWNKGTKGVCKSWMKGKKHTEDSIRKQKEAHKGARPWNKETRGLQKAWNKGKKGFKHTEEARRKISESLIGNKRNTGKKLSETHKEKISQSGKTAWIKRRQ